MIDIYKKLISLSNSLSPLQQDKMIELLEKLSNRTNQIEAFNNSLKCQLNVVGNKTYNDNLQKTIDVLKLLGFSQYSFDGIYPEFLNWLVDKTCYVTSYNPKLMNYYLLTSMQQAYMICSLEKDSIPTYTEVKKCMLTFDKDIEEKEKELKLSLPELINRIDGEN